MSGDWIPVTLPSRLRALMPHADQLSLGGATEASIWSILHPIGRLPPEAHSVPYGRPMANQELHVLDRHCRRCPVLVPGDLYIGGSGLAIGYWDDPGRTASSFIIAPDGSRFIYVTNDAGLLMRTLSDLTPKPVAGTGEAWSAVFSPDGQSAALVSGVPGALKVVPIGGGNARVLVPDSTYGRGVVWDGDWIYYLHGPAFARDLMRIPSGGGTPEFVARPDSTANALFYYWPQMLPGGKKMLLTVYPVTGTRSVGVLDLASKQVTLLAAGSFGRYALTGHVLVLQEDGTLQAARFDASTGTLRGAFSAVVDGVEVGEAPATPFTLSGNGTLVYNKAAAPRHVVRVSRADGREEFVDPEWRGNFGPPSLSPDGTQLAVSVKRGGREELWLRSLTSGTFSRLSADGTTNYRPSWTPDRLLVESTRPAHRISGPRRR